MKIHAIGWYGHENIGDESYKLSFPLLFPEHTFTFSEKLQPADAYILGGGDVVHGNYLNRLKDIKNKHIMSATVSNIVDLKDFKSACVRDLKSVDLAQSGGVKASFVPDFAFALTPNAERGKELIQTIFREDKVELYEKVVVVIINGFLMPFDSSPTRDAMDFQTLTYGLSKSIDNIDASFLFLPFGSHAPTDDRVANAWIASKCKFWRKNACVFNRLSVQDTLDIIAASNGIVSTRLHSSIFSVVSGVPFVDIVHNHKNESFLQTIGYKNFLSYRDFNSKQFIGCMASILNRDEQTRKELVETTSNYKRRLLQYSNEIKVLF